MYAGRVSIIQFWFAAGLLFGVFIYTKYINYYLAFFDLTVVCIIGFVSLALGLVVCVMAFLFIQRHLTGPIPIVIFTITWMAGAFLLYFSLSESCSFDKENKRKFANASHPIIVRYANLTIMPLELRDYQVFRKCCILRDPYIWKFNPTNQNTPVFPCCISIVRACTSPTDWYPNKCIPEVISDHAFVANAVCTAGVISVICLIICAFMYGVAIRQDYRRQKEPQEEEIENDRQDPEGEGRHTTNMWMCIIP